MNPCPIVLCLGVVLVVGCDRADPPAPPQLKRAAPTASAETTAPEASVWSSIKAGAPGALQATIKAEMVKAAAKQLKPVVYIGATWCKPCVAIKKFRRDPLMLDALKGIYVVDLDLDDWKAAEITGLGFKAGEVPHFYLIDAEGRSTGRTITSSVWGDDIPANMAPPLKAFFSG